MLHQCKQLLKRNDLLRLLDVQVSAGADLYEAHTGRHRHVHDYRWLPLIQMATTDLDDLRNALVGLLSPDLGVIQARNLPQLLHPGHDLIDSTVDQAEVIGLLDLQGSCKVSDPSLGPFLRCRLTESSR